MKIALILAFLLIVSRCESMDGISQSINQVKLAIDFNKFVGDNSKLSIIGSEFNNMKNDILEMKSMINELKEQNNALTDKVKSLKSQILTKYQMGRKAAEWQTQHLLASGFGHRKQSYKIKFANKFTQVPQVNVSISRYDMSGNTNQRLKVFAENITNEGFDLVFTTWFDTIVYSAEASWVAIGK